MDEDSLSTLLADHQVATAESCTAGLVAQALAQLPDASEWFRGGLVAYQREVKFRRLGVTPGPVVTVPAVIEMARGAQRLFGADVAISVTGAAGPEPHDGAEPGTVIIGITVGDTATATNHHFDGVPAVVCARARIHRVGVARRRAHRAPSSGWGR